jgi:hypothetical protein
MYQPREIQKQNMHRFLAKSLSQSCAKLRESKYFVGTLSWDRVKELYIPGGRLGTDYQEPTSGPPVSPITSSHVTAIHSFLELEEHCISCDEQ